MKKMLKAYQINNSDTVVTKKSLIHNVEDSDFTEVSLIISVDEIKEWAEEVERMELDDEEDFY